MKESSLMRVLFCKIHCPFICFCKPSAAHLYTSGPLKLESGPHVTPTLVSDQQSVTAEVKEESPLDGNQLPQNDLKSCIRKIPISSKKRVQWMDNIGKELAEIKEFESRYVLAENSITFGSTLISFFAQKNVSAQLSETGDTDTEEEARHCLCIIL